jgi:galactokinase
MSSEMVKQEFVKRFNREPEVIFYCPGRVNLIGEHIDYNGGKVMPCAIDAGTWLAISRNIDKKIRFECLNFPETAALKLQDSYSKSGKAWYNYPLGVIHMILQQDHALSGLDMLFYGNIPIGAGLSSSASIEVLTGFAISEIFGLRIPLLEIALLSKNAENNFVGVNCGIMDQFAVAMGKKDHAILLDCDTLDYEYIPFVTGDYALAVINSNKKRTLADSKYNERFRECGAALKYLKQELDIQHLCDVDMASFEKSQDLIPDTILRKRALHVISENARVKDAVLALQTGDLSVFGKLMYASHQSLKDNYEVSGTELDTIVEFCKEYPHCAGARMTGAGFGGCAIALVHLKSFEDFSEKLGAYYEERIGYTPDCFISTATDGVH